MELLEKNPCRRWRANCRGKEKEEQTDTARCLHLRERFDSLIVACNNIDILMPGERAGELGWVTAVIVGFWAIFCKAA